MLGMPRSKCLSASEGVVKVLINCGCSCLWWYKRSVSFVAMIVMHLSENTELRSGRSLIFASSHEGSLSLRDEDGVDYTRSTYSSVAAEGGSCACSCSGATGTSVSASFGRDASLLSFWDLIRAMSPTSPLCLHRRGNIDQGEAGRAGRRCKDGHSSHRKWCYARDSDVCENLFTSSAVGGLQGPDVRWAYSEGLPYEHRHWPPSRTSIGAILTLPCVQNPEDSGRLALSNIPQYKIALLIQDKQYRSTSDRAIP